MAHFIEHLGKGGMEALWASFGEVSFDEATSNLLIDQTAQFYGATPTADLVAGRDAREVAILERVQTPAPLIRLSPPRFQR
jgi:ketoreductase RED1